MTQESGRTWLGGYGAGRYRLLVVQDASGVLGAAYSSRYRPSSAFDTTVETSIYLHPDRRRAESERGSTAPSLRCWSKRTSISSWRASHSPTRRRTPCIAGWASRRWAPSRIMRASAAPGSVRHGSSAAWTTLDAPLRGVARAPPRGVYGPMSERSATAPPICGNSCSASVRSGACHDAASA